MAGSKIDANNPQARTKVPLLPHDVDHQQGPWKPVLRMKELKLNDITIQWLKKHGTDGVKFLNSDSSKPSNIYNSTLNLISDMYLIEVRKLFMALYHHDLDRLIRPNISCEGKFRPLTFEELVAFEGSGSPEIKPEMMKLTNEMSEKGAVLYLLAQECGPGCLFFLADKMSNKLSGSFLFQGTVRTFADHSHSLLDKHTKDSRHVEAGIAHLKRLGLDQKMKDSGAKELGENFRHFLIHPFEKKVVEKRAQVEEGNVNGIHAQGKGEGKELYAQDEGKAREMYGRE